MEASGVSDRTTGGPVEPANAFFLGSVSKVYTAATVLRLVEAGDLALDDVISRYLPTLPRGDEITSATCSHTRAG